MKKIIFLIFILLASSACIKKEQKQNSESQIVDLLNQNQTDAAIAKIDQELSVKKTDELLYLKASTLSMKAGVDIYALFPLLKVKIFDVAISQWSQNREFQKKAEAQRAGISLGNDDINNQKNEKNFTPLSGKDLDYKIEYISAYPTKEHQIPNGDWTSDACHAEYTIKSLSNKLEFSLINTQFEIENNKELCENIIGRKIDLTKFTPPTEVALKIVEAIQAKYKDKWFMHNEKITNKDNYMKILGSIWTMIDMVPMISKIPKVSKEGFNNLAEAQEILVQIKNSHHNKTDELGEKSRKQLMMLSALKIVAHVQNAVDLTVVKSPVDILCNSNEDAAQEFVESEKDAFYLLEAIDDPEIIKKNKELFDNIKTNYKYLMDEEDEHPEKKDEKIVKLKFFLDASKKDNCNQ